MCKMHSPPGCWPEMQKEMVMLGSGPSTGVECFGPIEKTLTSIENPINILMDKMEMTDFTAGGYYSNNNVKVWQ